MDRRSQARRRRQRLANLAIIKKFAPEEVKQSSVLINSLVSCEVQLVRLDESRPVSTKMSPSPTGKELSKRLVLVPTSLNPAPAADDVAEALLSTQINPTDEDLSQRKASTLVLTVCLVGILILILFFYAFM